MEKSKPSAKPGVKQQRPGQEQVQSSTNIQRGQQETLQQPKQGEQLKHKQQPHGKQGKK